MATTQKALGVRGAFWRRIDYLMLLALVGLIVYGVALIHSATCQPGCERWFPPSSWAVRQALTAILGIVLLAFTAAIDYRFFRAGAYYLHALSLVLLVVVLFTGRGAEEYGARRWIQLGLFDLQPSEIAKLTYVLALGRFMADRPDGPLSWMRLVGSVALFLITALLVYVQPDLGSALAFLAIWIGITLASGARFTQLGTLFIAAVALAPIGWFALRDYMRTRIFTFLTHFFDRETDPFGEGYNILQAQISIGSGGMFGRGFMQGTQTQLDYLRVKQSDFIFSVLAEEMGFLGALVLFLLFGLLLFRIISVAGKARDEFGRLVAFGVGFMLLFQCFVNLGANLTLLPVTGVPLPFLSYGRSALLTNLIALGILQGILIRRVRYRF
ncbi:MAG TPA: rod shape-determining protein RodA [Chloroflexota bacterium]|jgi:rod shape determining protein RodA|nr:rod shape-determining protein RodA [Chloroflexota bacterium]